MVEKGYGVVPGRSRDKAKRLLEAAAKVKVDGALIRTTSQGYEVPVKVLDAYEKSVQKDGEPDDGSIRRDKGSNPETIPPRTAEEAIEREHAAETEVPDEAEGDDSKPDPEGGDQTEADAAAAAAAEKAEKDAAAAKEAESKDKAKTTSTKSTPAKAEGK